MAKSAQTNGVSAPGVNTAGADGTIVAPVASNALQTRFQCTGVTDLPGAVYQERVYLGAVANATAGGDKNENASFSSGTPSGSMELLIDNPETQGFFKSGQEYLIAITPVGPVVVAPVAPVDPVV